MRALAIAIGVVAAALNSRAAEGKQVTYSSGNEQVSALLFTPSGKGPFPALIVIHEWWGLNDWVKQQASELAGQGYAALAIDLYRGKVAATPDEAHELARGVPEDRALRDLKAAFSYLAAQKGLVDPNRIADIGWCMGGGYALDLAIAEPGLRAAVINYGHLATDPARLKAIHAAVLGIFGGKDRGIPVSDVQRFEQQMKDLGKTVSVTVYPDAGHAFQNPGNPSAYRAADTADAKRKTFSFLHVQMPR